MWYLILVVCGSTCQMDAVLGTYSKKETCEQVVVEFTKGDSNWQEFRRSAYCLPAPDDIVYE